MRRHLHPTRTEWVPCPRAGDRVRGAEQVPQRAVVRV